MEKVKIKRGAEKPTAQRWTTSKKLPKTSQDLSSATGAKNKKKKGEKN